MATQLQITPFNQYHRQNAKLSPYAGWEMPLWFQGISEEHLAVRKAVGLFDVSHMGRFRFTGNDATSFLQRTLPSDVEQIKTGKAFYSAVLDESGGILDDVVTLKIDENDYLMIVNAANIATDFGWFKQIASSFSVGINDISSVTALIALQGPKATFVLRKMIDSSLDNLKYFSFLKTTIEGFDTLISRTGYTGEDGFELIVFTSPVETVKSLRLWSRLLEVGAPEIQPCGLGARDTLRLEAGFCLHGQDISQKVTPLEAGLDSIVNFDKPDFIGKQALLQQKLLKPTRIKVHAKMKTAGIPRPGYKFFHDDEEIGEVTSGTFSPLLKIGIAMGYIDSTKVNSRPVSIDLRGRKSPVELVPRPFYDASRYGRTRKLTKNYTPTVKRKNNA
ncbi:MAG: glycine cleavage system aminomethyltransferase GcvT [Candidatus Bathyarchaeia archaeon]